MPCRKLLVALTLGLACCTTHAEVIRLSEPVASNSTSETFGTQIDQDRARLTLGQLVQDANNHLGKPVLVEARVGKVCQKKGCFFMATEGSLALRVSFRDYGFFVPTDSGGKQVLLAAELISRELTEKEAAHYRADTGDNKAAINAGRTYELIADAVQLANLEAGR